MLRRLASACYDRRHTVLARWVSGLVGLLALASVAGGVFEDNFELPGSESQEAADLLEASGFPTQAGFQGQLVIQAEPGVDDPAVRQAVTDLLERIEAAVEDISTTRPYEAPGGSQVSDDGTIAFAQLSMAPRPDSAYADAADAVRSEVQQTEVPGGRVELGGDRFAEEAEGGGEAFGLLGAMVVLLIAFGSLLAMGLPILTALFGIGTGTAIVMLLANVLTMPSFTVQLVLMLGIGVGIDYALFIVTRYREALADGVEPRAAVQLAMDTAGRAVLFAGTTVVVSVLGLLVVGLDVNRALAVAAAAGVAMTMVAAVTLLPAVLGFVGRTIDRFGLPHRHRASDGTSGVWVRWSRFIQRRPVLPALLVTALLVALALPTAAMRLGFGDAGNRPETDTTRRAYDLLAEGFGAGANGPLILAARTPDQQAQQALEQLHDRLGGVDGVANTTPVIPAPNGEAAMLQVLPTSAPQAEATTELVDRLRQQVIPTAEAGTDLTVLVGGGPAGVVDFAAFTADRLPVFIAVVLAVSFLVLMLVFRSVLVPLKAVLMNLLSIGAAYGVLVAVFQWGWGLALIGGGEPGPVEAWVPLMLFAIVFGLSMDYEVFLLSRIREDYDRTGDNATAVAHGLAATARVITAAAAIMFLVFGGFVLSADRSLQLFGLGLATAILVDATLVRLVIVPATMELLGDRNWWLPAWVDRLLPQVHVEAKPPGEPQDDQSPSDVAASRGAGQ